MANLSTFTAGMDLNYIDAVCVASDGEIYQVTYAEDQARSFVGFVSSACKENASVGVYLPSQEVYGFSGLVAGTEYYLNGNVIAPLASVADGRWTRLVGTAKTSSVLMFDKGEPFQKGASSSENVFEHVQAEAATTWTISHNLGFYPDVFVMDESETQVEASVQHTSLNQTVITFATATAGRARLD